VLLDLTAEGRALHGELFPLVSQINAQLLAVLDGEAARGLDASLAALQARAEAMVAQAELPKADRARRTRA
jgi:hypothetical protein